jgi:hypothetical protein
LVAEAIAAAADAADAAQRWQRQFETMLAPELRRAFVLRQLLSSTSAKNLATWLLERGTPVLGTRMHRAIFGETPYRDAWRGRGQGQPTSPPKRS